MEFEKEELTIGGDNFDFSTLSRYTQLKELYCYNCPLLTCLPELPATLTTLYCSWCPLLTCLPELPATLTVLKCSQEYFFDKYDYEINNSTIKKYRNDPITEERREINGMFNPVFK
jgi:hypothetical protein